MPQHIEEILHEIAKLLNRTYAELMGMIQGFQIYFALNPSFKGVEGPCWAAHPIWPNMTGLKLNLLCFPARPFYALRTTI